MIFKHHALHHISIIIILSCIQMCEIDCVLVGLDLVEPMILFILHVICSCILMHTFFLFNILAIFELFGSFFIVSFFPSLSCLCQSCLWHQNLNPLYLGTLFILGHRLPLILLLLISGPVMRMPERTSRRTFLDEVFIQNAKSFWQTSPTLTYSMSFTVEVGSHCVTSQSLVLPC